MSIADIDIIRLTPVIAAKGGSIKYCPSKFMGAKGAFHDYFCAV